jgi:hypothetical protein
MAAGLGCFVHAQDLNEGLVAYWSFDEGSGDIAHDDSGNGNDGTVYGATWVAGVSGYALEFDGVGDYVERPYDPDFTPGTGPWTVAAWVKAAGGSISGKIVSWYRCGADPHCSGEDSAVYRLSVSDNNTVGWWVRDDDGNGDILGGTGPVGNGYWHHVAGTFEPADDLRSLYLDGTQVNMSLDFLTSLEDGGVSIPLDIGRVYITGWGEPCGYFDGIIDEVRIHDRALSEGEIQDLWGQFACSVSGTVRFVGDDDQTHPAKYVEVNIYDENVVYPDHLIVSGFTDGSGDFCFDQDANGEPIWNEDSEPFGGAPDIYVEVLAKNEAAVVSSTAVGLPYGGETDTITKPSGGLINFGTIVFAEENSAAFGFLAPAWVARQWMVANTGFWPEEKRVVYPDPNGPYWEVGWPGSIRMEVSNLPPYGDERMSEFFHEYGHGVHDEVRPGYNLPGEVGSTSFHHETDEGTALSEGWAMFFQTAVVHGPFDVPPTGYWWYDLYLIEKGAYWYLQQHQDGNIVQGSVACIFWDLYDAANDDGIDQQLSQIWAVMSDEDNPPDRMWTSEANGDFYHYWTARYGESREFQEIFIDHGIPVRDDDGEENDIKADAFDLGELGEGDHSYQNLICIDDDWWAFTISAPAAAGDRVLLTFSNARGNLDLEVYDAFDGLVGSSAGSADSESVDLYPQPAGTYYVRVYGKDDDYNPNYKLTISLSSAESAPPTNLDLPEAYDTGRYDTDDVTTINTPHIVGYAPADSTVRLYVGPPGDYTLMGSGTASPSGEFDVPITTPLSEGPNEITATAEEAGKSESVHSSPPLIVTIDTQAPEAPSTPDMTYGSDTGRFISDDVTYNNSPTFEGTAEPDAEVKLYEGETELGSVITPDGNWQITSSPLNEGQHQIAAKAIDAAGNESDMSSALPVLIDLTPPVISDTSITPDECRPIGQVFEFQMTASDALSGMQDAWSPEASIWDGDTLIDDFYLDPRGGDVYAASWDSSGTDAGVYDLDFEAWDLAGNSQLAEDAETVCLEEPIPGDLNNDGCVDQADLGILLTDWGCTGGDCPGDCDGDGDTDQSDLGILLTHWGEGCP